MRTIVVLTLLLLTAACVDPGYYGPPPQIVYQQSEAQPLTFGWVGWQRGWCCARY